MRKLAFKLEPLVSSGTYDIIVIKDIIDFVYILASQNNSENWTEYLRTCIFYCEFLFHMLLTMKADEMEILFIGPTPGDLGPQKYPQDPLGYETGTILEDIFSNACLDFGIHYVSVLNPCHERIFELAQQFPDNHHFALVNGIHLTNEAVQLIANTCAKVILNLCVNDVCFH